jgi:hypothetical protein
VGGREAGRKGKNDDRTDKEMGFERREGDKGMKVYLTNEEIFH